MSNKDLITRIRKSVADYQADRIGRHELLSSLELNSDALEGLSPDKDEERKALVNTLELLVYIEDEESFKNKLIPDIENWLNSL